MSEAITEAQHTEPPWIYPRAQNLIRHWRRTYPPAVVRYVTEFSHGHLYQVTPLDAALVLSASDHALGELDKQVDQSYTRDARVPFSLTHLYHGLLETAQAMPTWQQFREVMLGSRRRFWFGPVVDAAMRAGATASEAEAGALWRMANGWQSCTREVEFLARVRHRYGIPIEYHLLVDCLLRVDFWLGNRFLCLRVPNRMEGRKSKPEDIFPCPPCAVHRVAISHQGQGRVWLVDEAETERAVAFLTGGA